MNTLEQLTQALDDLIEKDCDLAERLIEKHLARLALKKRLKEKQENSRNKMSTNDGGPAFPVQNAAAWQAHGMSLRDYFAAKAMQAATTGSMEGLSKEGLAVWAYQMADAMLTVRTTGENQ